MTEQERLFHLANNFKILIAFEDSAMKLNPPQPSQYKTIGERKLFIEELEKNGYTITKIPKVEPITDETYGTGIHPKSKS